MPALATAAVESLPDRFFGVANAMNATFRQVGAALGVAAVVSFLGQGDARSPVLPYEQPWTFIAVVALSALPLAAGIRAREPAQDDAALEEGLVPAFADGGIGTDN